jgi:hypothetical protein
MVEVSQGVAVMKEPEPGHRSNTEEAFLDKSPCLLTATHPRAEVRHGRVRQSVSARRRRGIHFLDDVG